MRRGFTLVEMSVVLLVIAIVTHLAMRQLGSVRDRKLVSAADRQLGEIRDSVFAIDGTGEPTGFLSDMGRLVSVTNGTLSELWRLPAGVRAYAVRPAVAANFVRLPTATLHALTNENVFVGTGWRGPYLRLPVGKSRLRDSWGNPLENPDSAGLNRLGVTNGVVYSVSHFGPTAIKNDTQARTLSLVPDRGATSRLILSVVSTSGQGPDSVTYKWYGPASGLITGGVTNEPYGTPARFVNLTPGVRVVWDSASSVARMVRILPGDNQVEIKVP